MLRLRPCFSLLLAVAALTAIPIHLAVAQATPEETSAAPRSPGLDVAGMDRSVKPGDDFFEYANGTWLKQTEIPADRSAYGAGAILTELTDRRVAELIQEAAKADAPAGSDLPEDRRLLRQLHGHDGHRAGGPHAAQAHARLHRRHPATGRTWPAFLGSTLRADVDALNNTNFYTENLFGLWVAQDLDDPTHYSPFLLQGGLGMPDRSYYLDSSSAHGDDPRQVPGSTSPRCSGWPACADARRQGRGDRASSRPRIAQAHWSREAVGRRAARATTTGRAPTSPPRRPGLDWDAYFAAAGLGQAAAVRRLAAERGHRHLRARRRASRSRPGRTT